MPTDPAHPDERQSLRGFVPVYALAHGGKSLLWHASELLFAYYLTEACDIAPRRMGAILAISLVLNALADLLVGVAFRRVQSLQSAGRLQLLGALGSAAAMSAFGMSAFVAQLHARVIFAFCTLVVFRLTYALLDTPQNAMLALATRDDAQRAHLSSIRYIFGGAANIIVATLFAPTFRLGGAAAQGAHFAFFAVLLGSIGVCSSCALWLYLRPLARSHGPDLTPVPMRAGSSVCRLWPILGAMFAVSVGLSIFGRLEPYLATYGVRTIAQGGALLTCVAVGTVAFQPLWVWIGRRYSLLTALRLATVGLIVGALAFGGLLRQGVVMSIALGGCLYGAFCGGVLMSLWALTAAASNRLASPTLAFGMLTCITKLALALAAFGVGEVLAAATYRSSTVASVWILPSMVAGPALAGVAVLLFSSRMRPASPSGGNAPLDPSGHVRICT